MKPRGLIVGLALAAVAQLLAFFLAGAGHGWTAPLFCSAALWVLLPSTLLIVWPVDRGSWPLMLGLLAIGLAADAWLINRAIDEVRYILRYVEINGILGMLIILLWLGLWLCWQMLLVQALITGRKRAHEIDG